MKREMERVGKLLPNLITIPAREGGSRLEALPE